MSEPIVAIVGEPNVGKSTLWNCLVGSRQAIISEQAGTTRDRLIHKISPEDGIPYWLVDTAGVEAGRDDLERAIQEQVQLALKTADILVLVLDYKAPPHFDEATLKQLRSRRDSLLLLVNKIDDGQSWRSADFLALGLGEPIAISARNYWQIPETEARLQTQLQQQGFSRNKAADLDSDTIRIALVGRPNVGKSTLINSLLGHARSTVSSEAGTTRDTIVGQIENEEGQFEILDTAGLRRPGLRGREIEYWSALRTQQSIGEADVCVLLLDALEGVTHQDLVIAGEVIAAGKGLVIGVNKFDLVRQKSREDDDQDERDLDLVPMWGKNLDHIRDQYRLYLQHHIRFAPWAPVLFFSGQTQRGLSDIWASAKGIFAERQKRLSTSHLNRWVVDARSQHNDPSQGNKRGKIKYVTQAESEPPCFVFFVNNAKAFHFSYRRFLENKLRESYGFMGTPIRLEFRDAMEDKIKKGRK